MSHMSDEHSDQVDESVPVDHSDPVDASAPVEVDGDSSAGAPPSMTLDRRKSIIAGIVAIVFLGIVFWKVIPQIGSYSDALTSLQQMPKQYLAYLAIAVLLYLFLYGWPFVASVPGLKFGQGEIVNQSAFAVSNGVPAGGALGLGLQYAQLTSYKATPTAATAGITATGVWSTFITLALPVMGVITLVIGGENAGKYVVTGLIGIAILATMLIVFALILRSEELAGKVGGVADRAANAVMGRFRPGTRLDLTASILKLRTDIVDLVKRRWAAITAAQFAVSLSSFLILLVAFRGVESASHISGWSVFAAFAISQLGLMIPVTPGGLGTVDAAMISLLITFGASSGDATAADLLWRAVSYVPQIVIGLVCIFYWRVQVRRERKKEALGAAGRG